MEIKTNSSTYCIDSFKKISTVCSKKLCKNLMFCPNFEKDFDQNILKT